MDTAPIGLLHRISLVCVPTREQDQAVAFYESIGFKKCVDTTFGPGYRWIEVYLPESKTGLGIAPPPGDAPITPVITGITLNTLNIEAAHAHFKAIGADVDAEIVRMGDPVPPMFWFRDPSGHTLMVVEQP